jgi:uncharacterized protein (TIGR02444 family)
LFGHDNNRILNLPYVETGQLIEGLWDFSVRTYRSSGVSDICLSLQNDHGADVNMLLFCCWAGARNERLGGELFDRASEFSKDWADGVVIPLRSARTWMKTAGGAARTVPTDTYEELREKIKSVELLSEKMQLQVLESLSTADRPQDAQPEIGPVRAIANLFLYTQHGGIETCAEIRKKFTVLVSAAFPDCDHQVIEKALEH